MTLKTRNEIEYAIQCFERITGLSLVVHDINNRLWGELEQSRFQHGHALCQKVKQGKSHKCIAFEIDLFRSQAAECTSGRIHRCFAGLIELVLPVFDKQKLSLVLFAGPFRIDDKATLDFDGKPIQSLKSKALLTDKDLQKLTLIKNDDLTFFQEHLRQLGSRIRCYIDDQPEELNLQKNMPRRLLIQRYIDIHHAKPIQVADLAKALHLSVERTRHVVLEECEQHFSKLLRKARIHSACGLLINTDLPLNEIAELCGLPDISGFSRAFKSSMGNSPAKWRSLNRG